MWLSFENDSKKIVSALLIVVLCFLSTGCSENTLESNNGTLSLNISNRLSSSGQMPQNSPLQEAAVNNITITSAKITIGRIRFKSVDDFDSLDFRSDVPMIVNLQVDSTVQNIGTISIPSGTYDETRFRIERVTDSDSAVYVDNPDMQDLSIRVSGYVNGDVDSVFVWSADFMEDQVHQFEPFTIAAGETVNLVFEFDQTSWFVDDAGLFIDPRESLSSGSVQSQIENNIKEAFKVTQQ